MCGEMLDASLMYAALGSNSKMPFEAVVRRRA